MLLCGLEKFLVIGVKLTIIKRNKSQTRNYVLDKKKKNRIAKNRFKIFQCTVDLFKTVAFYLYTCMYIVNHIAFSVVSQMILFFKEKKSKP